MHDMDGRVKYMFASGRGGLPGNNDNGGLSSCYLWNTIGIFPASGQDLMFIGSPHMGNVPLNLSSGKKFKIECVGEGIYVQKAELDGQALEKLSFPVRRMMQGGVLKLWLSEDGQRFP